MAAPFDGAQGDRTQRRKKESGVGAGFKPALMPLARREICASLANFELLQCKGRKKELASSGRIETAPRQIRIPFANYAFFAAKSFFSFGCRLRHHSRAFAAGFLQ